MNLKISKLAGFGYLAIFITGFFANFFVLERLVDLENASLTATNILANELLFRTGIFSFILMVVFDIVLAWALYILLKPVDKNLSLLSGWLRLVNSTVFGVALYHLFSMLRVLNGAGYLKAFVPDQLQAMVLMSFNSFNDTWLVGLVFFGLHLLALGYLIFKSGYIPRIIGVLLVIAGFGYLADSFANFILINYNDYKNVFQAVVIIPGVVGELSLTFWLLFKSVRNEK